LIQHYSKIIYSVYQLEIINRCGFLNNHYKSLRIFNYENSWLDDSVNFFSILVCPIKLKIKIRNIISEKKKQNSMQK